MLRRFCRNSAVLLCCWLGVSLCLFSKTAPYLVFGTSYVSQFRWTGIQFKTWWTVRHCCQVFSCLIVEFCTNYYTVHCQEPDCSFACSGFSLLKNTCRQYVMKWYFSLWNTLCKYITVSQKIRLNALNVILLMSLLLQVTVHSHCENHTQWAVSERKYLFSKHDT